MHDQQRTPRERYRANSERGKYTPTCFSCYLNFEIGFLRNCPRAEHCFPSRDQRPMLRDCIYMRINVWTCLHASTHVFAEPTSKRRSEYIHIWHVWINSNVPYIFPHVILYFIFLCFDKKLQLSALLRDTPALRYMHK